MTEPSAPQARTRPAFLGGIDRRAHAVAAGSLLFLVARMGLMTYLAIFLVEDRGLTLTQVGLAFLLENVMRAVAAPLAGALSDRVGRRPVLLATAAACAVVLPGFLLVRDLPTLLVWSAISGLTQGPWFPTASALLLDVSPPEHRQRALAYHYGVISVGYTLGVVPGGFLAQFDYTLLAVQSVLALVVVALLVLVAMREPPRAARAPSSVAGDVLAPVRDPGFVLLAALAFLFPLGMGLLSFAVPAYAKEAGVAEGIIGLGLGTSGLIMAAIILPITHRVEASGPFRWLPAAALLAALAYLAFAAGASLPLLAAGVLVFTLSEALFSTAIPTAVSHMAPPGQRGAYQGAWAMVLSLGIGSALVLGGLGRDAIGWPATWLAFAGLTLVAGVGLALARGWFRRTAARRVHPE